MALRNVHAHRKTETRLCTCYFEFRRRRLLHFLQFVIRVCMSMRSQHRATQCLNLCKSCSNDFSISYKDCSFCEWSDYLSPTPTPWFPHLIYVSLQHHASGCRVEFVSLLCRLCTGARNMFLCIMVEGYLRC